MTRTYWILLNWVCLYGAMAAPALLGTDDRHTLVVTSFMVGVQVGQTVVVQTSSPPPLLGRLTTLTSSLLASLILLVTVSVDQYTTILVLATLSGLMAGVPVGKIAAGLLARSRPIAYQRMLAIRSAFFLAATLMSSIAAVSIDQRFGPLLLAAIGPASILLHRGTNPPSLVTSSTRSERRSLVGAAASLLYRNDANWVRAAVAGTGSFSVWNIGLIGYAGLQAVLGVAVVHTILAKRSIWRERVGRNRRALTLALVSVTTLSAAASIAVIYESDLRLVALIGAIAAVVTTFASALAHTVGRSMRVYVFGSAGAVTLLALLAFVPSTSRAVVWYLALLAVAVTSTLVFPQVRDS